MKLNLIIEIISALLAILFVYAALSKLLSYDTFLLQLSQSPFITAFANIIVWVLPAVEIAAALLLAFSHFRLYGLYGALFLLTLFTAYLVAMLNFSYYIPCSCGGILASLSWKQHIVLNAAFIIITLTGIRLYSIETDAKN